MARERISLVADDVKQQMDLESRILAGEITSDNFNELSPDEQSQVNATLFKMASTKIDPNQGASALEFILFGFMRIMNKKINGMSLSEEEKSIEASLNRIWNKHELTNASIGKESWLFDYMAYAELKSTEFLRNRKEHIERKTQVTGKA
ncbi:hypothetical protein FU976_08035 [Campylobacter jejuni]|nr:hypothetical protein [Campylobacter jejuni]